MELPRRVIVGDNALELLPRLLEGLAMRKLLVVTGPNVRKRVETRLSNLAEKSGHQLEWCVDVESKRTSTEEVAEIVRLTGAQGILGVGGGKVVDVAKLGAHMTGIPMFSIPTSASHDGIASPFASLREMEKPYSLVASSPMGVLADLNVIRDAPERLLKSGCGDLVAKFTAVRDWELARDEKGEYYGNYAAHLAELSANMVLEHSNGLKTNQAGSVRAVVEALISAGVAAGIAGSSRPCSGAEHLFSHALDGIAPGKGLHGEKCGIGAIMLARLHNLDWEAMASALRTIGAPVTAEEIGLTAHKVAEGLRIAPSIRPERYTILHKLRLSYDEAMKLAREVHVI